MAAWKWHDKELGQPSSSLWWRKWPSNENCDQLRCKTSFRQCQCLVVDISSMGHCPKQFGDSATEEQAFRISDCHCCFLCLKVDARMMPVLKVRIATIFTFKFEEFNQKQIWRLRNDCAPIWFQKTLVRFLTKRFVHVLKWFELSVDIFNARKIEKGDSIDTCWVEPGRRTLSSSEKFWTILYFFVIFGGCLGAFGAFFWMLLGVIELFSELFCFRHATAPDQLFWISFHLIASSV